MNFLGNKFYKFLTLDIYFFISFISLIIATVIFFMPIGEKKKARIFFIFFLGLIAVFSFKSYVLTKMQYLIWLNHPISKYLVYPYASSNDYFRTYVFFHFWRDLVFRLLGALVIGLTIIFINFLFKRDIFYDDEKIMMIYIALLFFFPYNLVIIFLGFFMLLLSWIIKLFVSSRKEVFQERLSFRNYWLILVWVCFLLQPFFLTNYDFLKYRPF
jgi:hypothetical protein